VYKVDLLLIYVLLSQTTTYTQLNAVKWMTCVT